MQHEGAAGRAVVAGVLIAFVCSGAIYTQGFGVGIPILVLLAVAFLVALLALREHATLKNQLEPKFREAATPNQMTRSSSQETAPTTEQPFDEHRARVGAGPSSAPHPSSRDDAQASLVLGILVGVTVGACVVAAGYYFFFTVVVG